MKTASENDGTLPTAPENAGRAERGGQSALTREEERQLTKYVVDRVIDSRMSGRRKLCRVRWDSFGPNDDNWESTKHLPQQFVARYEHSSHKKRGENWQ